MGADLIEHATDEFSRAVYIKGGSGNPLAFKGTVTTYTDTTHFKASGLAGFGNDYFGGPNNSWYVYAVRDFDGAGDLPQGEDETISDYVSSDGTFTHTAFTTPLAVGDEVLIVHSWAKAAAGGDATAANQTTIINYVDKIDDATNGLTAIKAEVEGLAGASMVGTNNAALEANIETHVTNSLNTYDPPTRSELTVDKNLIITEINANESKITTVDLVVDDILLEVAGLNGSSMIGTNNAALATVCTAGRLGELDAANIPADIDTLLSRNLFRTATKAITLSTAAVPVTEALFTVTGVVEIEFMSYLDVTVTSGGALTLEVGIAGATDAIIPQTAVGVLASGNLWKDTSPATFEYGSALRVLSKDKSITHTIAGAAATGGAITYYCVWRPLSSNGNVVAA